MRTKGEKIFLKSIVKPSLEIAKEGASNISNIVKDTKQYVKAVVYGRDNYPPKVRDIIDKVGNKIIKSITIKRTPVDGLLTGALNVFSLGKFGKRLEKNFDELFHLFIDITLHDNSRVSLEKNEVINMDINPKNRPKTESKIVNNVPQITINELLNNTQQYMGNRYFIYDAKNNNCQDFIMSVFKSNNIGNEEDYNFIKQDTDQLFKNLPYLKKFAHTVTNIGSVANVITTGSGILKNKNYIIQSIIFEKDKYNVKNAKKWLKENNYKYPKVDRTENYYRFQQINPNYIESKKYNEYITKDLDNSGIKLIIAYKKNKISSSNMQKKGGKIDIKKSLTKGLKSAKKYITDTGGLSSDLLNYGLPATTSALLGTPASMLGGPAAGITASALGSKLGVMASDEIAKRTVLEDRTGKGLKPRKGRMIKGSKEAKEWGAKMKALRQMK